MSSELENARARSARRLEQAADHQRMVLARRAVVDRARAIVLPRVEAANDAEPDAA